MMEIRGKTIFYFSYKKNEYKKLGKKLMNDIETFVWGGGK
jgi:hypothetical protein